MNILVHRSQLLGNSRIHACSSITSTQAAPFPVKAYTHADVQAGFEAIKKHWPDSEIRVAVWNAALFVRKGFLELTESEIEESTREFDVVAHRYQLIWS